LFLLKLSLTHKKNMKINNNFFPYRICLIVLIIFFFLPNADVLAQKKSKKKTKKWNIDIGLATIYDDNILKYSKKYLDKFDKREDEGRFNINTYDDLVLSMSLKTSYTFKVFGKLKSRINVDLSRRQYINNDIKTWNNMVIGFRQYLTKQASMKFFYSYIPDFYINHFRDDDWVDVYGYTKEAFQPYSFAKESYGFWIQNTFYKNTRIMLNFSYEKYYHNKHFTEYDCDNFVTGIKLYQKIHKKVRLLMGYQFTNSDANAYDGPNETKATSDDSDATNVEDRFTFGFNWKLPRLKKHTNDLNVECRIQNRYYSSKHYLEKDRMHAGRVDKNFRLYVTYNIKLRKNLKLSAFYYWFHRNSDTEAIPNKILISDEKDYNQDQYGLKITYNLKM